MPINSASGNCSSPRPKALVVLVACGCLFSGAYGRLNLVGQEDLGTAPQRRALLQTQTFKVRSDQSLFCSYCEIFHPPDHLLIPYFNAD